MKKLFTGLMVVGLMAMGGMVYGATTADITVTVKIQNISVAVSPGSYDFGTMTAGSNEVAASSITVTNDGNITEKFQLSIPSEPNGTWTSVTAGAPGDEEYRMSGIFSDSGAGAFGAEDSFSVTTARVATVDDLAVTGDDAGLKGYSVAESTARGLWLKFEAPTSTVITAEQTITVRVTASAN